MLSPLAGKGQDSLSLKLKFHMHPLQVDYQSFYQFFRQLFYSVGNGQQVQRT